MCASEYWVLGTYTSPQGLHVLSSGLSRSELGGLKHWLHRQLPLRILTADETFARYEMQII